LYAPDYAANAGGVINGCCIEMLGWDVARAMDKIDGIYSTMMAIFEIAARDKIPTYLAADRLAEDPPAPPRPTPSRISSPFSRILPAHVAKFVNLGNDRPLRIGNDSLELRLDLALSVGLDAYLVDPFLRNMEHCLYQSVTRPFETNGGRLVPDDVVGPEVVDQ